MYVIFYNSKGLVLIIPVPKGKTVTANFYRNVVLRKLKRNYQIRRPKTILNPLRLLHNNAPAHKARIVTEFLESEKVKVLPLLLPRLFPLRLFPVSKTEISSTWKEI
jgi:histone-lysine N-methyltransferase SETMAR